MFRPGLRAKILALTALPLLALAGAALVLVDRGVSHRSEAALSADLVRAAHVFEDMLRQNATELEVTGKVIVEDPRFFSVLALPHGPHEDQFLATIAGVAQAFHTIAKPDVFEVVDHRAERVGSVGRIPLDPEVRAAFVAGPLAGRMDSCMVTQQGTHVLLVGTPVVTDGRVVGALLLGREVSGEMAERLRDFTESEVSFVDERHVTRTTLTQQDDRAMLLRLTAGGTPTLRTPVHEGGWIGYASPLPMSKPGSRQYYVLQRSLDRETAFLQSVRRNLVNLGLLILSAVFLATLFIAGHITRPIRQIVGAAKAMEEGDFDAPVDRSRGDELGTLATRFDEMRHRQRDYVRSLQDIARAKSEFIAIASHELRTPISIIRGWEEMLRDGYLKHGDPRFEDSMDAIARACTALEKIAISATHMAETDDTGTVVEPEWQELEPIVEEALAEAHAAAPERMIALGSEIRANARGAVLDRALVTQAVDQLVRNGIRFTPDGGSVMVVVRRDGDALLIEVRDNGIGLSEDVRRRLFDETFVSRDSRNHHTPKGLEFNVAGMGFGLTLARRIVEAHGGRLLVASEEGRGSVFTLVFPDAAVEPQNTGRAA